MVRAGNAVIDSVLHSQAIAGLREMNTKTRILRIPPLAPKRFNNNAVRRFELTISILISPPITPKKQVHNGMTMHRYAGGKIINCNWLKSRRQLSAILYSTPQVCPDTIININVSSFPLEPCKHLSNILFTCRSRDSRPNPNT